MYKNHSSNNMFKNFQNNGHIIIIILSIVAYVFFRSEISFEPVEDIDIPSGVGVDLIRSGVNIVEYSLPVSYYNYGTEEKITRFIHTGTANTFSGTRETRQLVSGKRATLGLERIFVASEDFAEFGINSFIRVLFKNPILNDTSFVSVCKGKSEDILSYNVPEYPSSADYIEGILERSTVFNFFSNNYKVIDLFVRMDSEGRSIVLPYIEIKNNKLQITGMALFKKDKMIKKIDIDESRIMNMLRENKVNGTLVLQENPKEYISYYAKTKRKVRCEKEEDDKYTFFIDLSLNGEIIENNLFHDIREKDKTMKEFENELSKQVEKMCYDFIEKMQKEYKVDCLELGRIAAAKFGRHRDVDWDEIVSKSDIKVNVKVKVTKMGRGDY